MIVDTLRFSKRLHQKGHVTVEQADVLAETAGSVTTEGLATKTGLAEVRTELLKRILGSMGLQTLLIAGSLFAPIRLFAK